MRGAEGEMRGLYIAVAVATAVNAALATSIAYSREKDDDSEARFGLPTVLKGVATAMACDVVGLAPLLTSAALARSLQ